MITKYLDEYRFYSSVYVFGLLSDYCQIIFLATKPENTYW